jgi:hypothetical protein
LFRRPVAVPLWILILSLITVIVISGATGLKLGKRSSVPDYDRGMFVVEINGKPVTDGRDLQRAVSEASP